MAVVAVDRTASMAGCSLRWHGLGRSRGGALRFGCWAGRWGCLAGLVFGLGCDDQGCGGQWYAVSADGRMLGGKRGFYADQFLARAAVEAAHYEVCPFTLDESQVSAVVAKLGKSVLTTFKELLRKTKLEERVLTDVIAELRIRRWIKISRTSGGLAAYQLA